MSPLETLHNIVTAFLYGESYNLKYFENSSTPRGVLDLGPNITEDQLDRFRTYWQSETVQQPHRTFVVGGASSGAKWTPIAITPKDMEFTNYMNWLMKIILAVFGVTPSEVGWTEEVRGAPATGQLLQSTAFRNKAIYPMMDKISYYLTRDIVWSEFGYDDLKFEFIEEQSLQEKMQKAQYDNMRLMSKIVTVNEIRKEEGLDPIEEPSEEMFSENENRTNSDVEEVPEDQTTDQEFLDEKNIPSAFNQLRKEILGALNKNVKKNNKLLAFAFQKLRFEILRAIALNKHSNEQI
jgi:phage portal protein BeeE